MRITEAALTVPEAAFVSGLTIRSINHEIDEGIIGLEPASGIRRIHGIDLLYLGVIRSVRVHIARKLRRRIRDAVVEAAQADRLEARVEPFAVALPAVEHELNDALERLEQIRRGVEVEPGILAGEPVLKGSRIAARHIADLVRQGASREEIAEDYDLTFEQIEAAVGFARIAPKRGRPSAPRADVDKTKPGKKVAKARDVPAA